MATLSPQEPSSSTLTSPDSSSLSLVSSDSSSPTLTSPDLSHLEKVSTLPKNDTHFKKKVIPYSFISSHLNINIIDEFILYMFQKKKYTRQQKVSFKFKF